MNKRSHFMAGPNPEELAGFKVKKTEEKTVVTASDYVSDFDQMKDTSHLSDCRKARESDSPLSELGIPI